MAAGPTPVRAAEETVESSGNPSLGSDSTGDGVEDPFPEATSRRRPATAGVLLSVAGVLSLAGGALARSSLKPVCDDRRDVQSCEIPNGADIGTRSGRLFGSIGFGVGGAAFGAVGGRALGQYLRSSPDGSGRPRRIAVGVGSSVLALGAVGIIAGSVLFGVYARRAGDLGKTFDGVTSPLSPQEVSRLGTTLDHVDRARTGLMLLVAAPSFVATGIALLVAAPPVVTVSPTANRTSAGLSLSGRF